MSSRASTELYPIMVVEDRYQGVYLGGRWWAVARADLPLEDMTRIAWLMDDGPGSDDITAAMFWADALRWIAAGSTADCAVATLIAQDGAAGDAWSPRAR